MYSCKNVRQAVMGKEHQKYHINKAETLEEIAEKLQIPVAALKYYHNLHSDPDQYIISYILPQHLKEILLPVDYEKEIVENKKTCVKRDIQKEIIKTQSRYGVLQRNYNNGELQDQLHYEVDSIEEITYDNLRKITIDKKKLWINDEEISLAAEKIFEQIGGLLYPLEVIIHRDGSFSEIINPQEIKNRWKDKRADLQSYYIGDASDSLFLKVDKFFNEIEKHQEKLLDNLFFKLFFTPLYRYYTDGNPYNYTDQFPLFPYKKGILFNTILTPGLQIGETGKFQMHLTGDYVDLQREKQIWPGSDAEINDSVTGDLDFVFKINASDKRIFSVKGYVEIKGKKNQRRIEFEFYQLNTIIL
ncbi:hypothetical protein [Chryseobacterium sp. H1D6B]|uniref:hypothetical protein n=1 Tax=Chryseobacterium sp. H1D6B TaxID=2940588 RepID=UPI0015CE319E|nr:hypothetical protein [Chryseobacterium sp. H1D6B]